jgi:Xaa-Pro dipeptidase
MAIQRRTFLKTGGLSIGLFGFIPSLFSCKENEPPFEGLENMTSNVKPLDPEDYERRLQKAKELMIANRVDGLLITGGTNMSYFLDASWWRSERFFGAIVNTKGDPIWICPAFEVERAKEITKFGTDIRAWEEHESPYTLVTGVMKDLGAANGKLAIGPTTRNFIVEGIRKAASGTKLQLIDGSIITDGCRGMKTEKELAFMDLANRITKIAYREAFKRVEEGMSPAQLRGYIQEAHTQMGTSGSGGPMFGPISAFPHGSREVRHLKDGDTILVDGGCSVEGYRSDVTRTIVFGKPTDRQKKVFDAVLKAQTAAHEAIWPGVPCETLDKVARKVIEDAGFGPEYRYFAHRLGHGIGMDGHEYPYLVRGNNLPLQPGMTFSNEPGIYIYGEFGVRIEDCFVVTEDGAKFLGGMTTAGIEQPFG